MQNSFLLKANRLSTKRRDSTTNHRDVPTAEEQENSKGTTIAEAAPAVTETAEEEASEIGGN